MIKTINPSSELLLKEFEEDSLQTVDNKIKLANDIFRYSKYNDLDKRCKSLRKVANILEQNKQSYAELITEEMGKPILQSVAEIEKCAWVCSYYSENGASHLRDEFIETEYQRSYIAYRPLGVILAIMPWNFPFWQVFRFAAPALIAGNTCLLKHASNTTGCGIAIEEIFSEAFGEGYFSTLLLSSKNMERVLNDKRIRGISLTGSTPAGKKVASVAANNLMKTVLELGGSDPYIILEDADIELAAKSCVTTRMINNGQSCIAGKRFIVQSSIYDEFIEKMKEELSNYEFGNPLKRGTNLGPIARKDIRDELHLIVQDTVKKGADKLLGGEMPNIKGYYYPATLLGNVLPGMPAFDEETFGPIAAVIKAKDENQAIHYANMTEFGLGAAIFTSDIEKGEFIAKEQLNAGTCAVNDYVKSDPRLPFGGINQSGYGRELSHLGIREFTNIKTIVVK